MVSQRGPIHRARLTRREALLFEAGIKLGGVFHQYLGTPVSSATAGQLGRTIARALKLQPYVRHAEVTIDPSRGGRTGQGRFGYHYLTAQMLQVRVHLTDGATRVVAMLRHRPDLRYPLMSVLEVSSDPKTPARSVKRLEARSRHR